MGPSWRHKPIETWTKDEQLEFLRHLVILEMELHTIFQTAKVLSQQPAPPTPMILHCPQCATQHIDKPEPEKGWTNPPHKSHLCAECGCIWRPADVPTTGVADIASRGKADTWPVDIHAAKPDVYGSGQRT